VGTVQHHVEFADRPGGGVVHLAAKAQVGQVAAGLFDVFTAADEHAARTAGGIIDAHPRRGVEHADHESNDVARGVEIAALLPGRFGEHVDEKLIGRAEQVGELKVLVAQAVAGEVAHQILAGLIGDDALDALHAHEADMVEHVLKRFILLAQGRKRLVEAAPIGAPGIV
jgi:hypothetical protein